jgi:hypothetical protein
LSSPAIARQERPLDILPAWPARPGADHHSWRRN